MCEPRIYRYNWRKTALVLLVCTAAMFGMLFVPGLFVWEMHRGFMQAMVQGCVIFWTIQVVVLFGKSWRLDDEGLSIYNYRKLRKKILWEDIESVSLGSVKDVDGKKYPISLEPKKFRIFRQDLLEMWAKKYPERCKQTPYQESKAAKITRIAVVVVGLLMVSFAVYKRSSGSSIKADIAWEAPVLFIALSLLVMIVCQMQVTRIIKREEKLLGK